MSYFLAAFRFSYQEPVVITKESDIMSAKFIGSVLGVVIAARRGDARRRVERIPRPAVPTNLEVSRDYKLFLKGHAVGTQNYICAPAATPLASTGCSSGRRPRCSTTASNRSCTHFPEPQPAGHNAIQATWQDSGDTSAVWATRRDGSLDANYVAPGAIEWLVLDVTRRAARTDGRRQARAERGHPARQHPGRREATVHGVHAGNAEHAQARVLRGRLLLLQIARCRLRLASPISE